MRRPFALATLAVTILIAGITLGVSLYQYSTTLEKFLAVCSDHVCSLEITSEHGQVYANVRILGPDGSESTAQQTLGPWKKDAQPGITIDCPQRTATFTYGNKITQIPLGLPNSK